MRRPWIGAAVALLCLAFPSAEALTVTGSLMGIIIDERWYPVAQAEIRAYPVGSDDEVVRVQASEMGGFRIEGLPAGWFDLEVRRPGFVPLRVPGVEVGPDSPENLGPLPLTRGKRLEGRAIEPRGAPLPRAARLSGRVVDPAGKAVSGAAVHASLSGASRGDFSPPSSRCPKAEGLSRPDGIAPGEWDVAAVTLEGRAAEAKIVIAPGDEKPVLDLVFAAEPQ